MVAAASAAEMGEPTPPAVANFPGMLITLLGIVGLLGEEGTREEGVLVVSM